MIEQREVGVDGVGIAVEYPMVLVTARSPGCSKVQGFG
jgi:hypothetical protein